MKILMTVCFLFLLFNAAAFAQEQSRSVELPSFVITGEEKFDLPVAEKIPAAFIPVLSDEYLKPSYPPEQLEAFLRSEAVAETPALPVASATPPNRLNASLGSLSFPSVEYSGLFFVRDFSLLAEATADYRRPHLANSGFYAVSPAVTAKYQLRDEGHFWHENELTASAAYNFSAFRMYAAPIPAERKTGNLSVKLGIENPRNNLWVYNAFARVNAFSMITSNASELSWEFGVKTGYSDRDFEVTPSFTHTQFRAKSNPGSRYSENLFNLRAPVSFNLWETLTMSGGLDLYASNSISAMYPFISFGLQFKKGFTFFASYHPKFDVLDMHGASVENRFVSYDSLRAAVYAKNQHIDIGFIFESGRMFDFCVSLVSFSSAEFPYYDFEQASGAFGVRKSEMKATIASFDFKLYPFSYGHVISTLKLRSYTSTQNVALPNIPRYEGVLAYAITEFHQSSLRAGIRFYGGQYADSANTRSLDGFVDPFVEGAYFYTQDFLITLTINNLLNQNNYLWQTYREAPFQFTAGISYRW